jgi:hypothetical protein
MRTDRVTNTLQFVAEERAAQILALSVKTLRAWRWRGEGPRFHKFGRAVRYSLSDLEAFVAANARESTTQHEPNVRQP